MRTIYIDSDFKCHTANDGTMTEVQTEFFNGKCNAFIEGYCYEVNDNGVRVYPWKPYAELDNMQREYERTQLADYKAALLKMGVVV